VRVWEEEWQHDGAHVYRGAGRKWDDLVATVDGADDGTIPTARLTAAAPEMARELLRIRAVVCEEDIGSIDAVLRRAGVIS
jgi:hypothetical protein